MLRIYLDKHVDIGIVLTATRRCAIFDKPYPTAKPFSCHLGRPVSRTQELIPGQTEAVTEISAEVSEGNA
jgi:hypothetical protein